MHAPHRPLLLPDGVVFTCQNSGACCRSDWLIGVDDGAHGRLRDVDWTVHDPALPKADAFVPLPFPLPSGERVTFARRPEGACVFLTGDPLPVALLAGSALLSLCIGLTQLEARAQREGRPAPATLAGGLAELAAGDYRKLLDIAAGARYPRRPALTYLAPLYTWLEMSR